MTDPLLTETPAGLARVLASIRSRFGAAEGAEIIRFASALFEKEGGPYVDELGEDAAAALATHAFRFLAAGGPLPRVRIFTPTFAADGWEPGGAVVETVMPDRPFIVDTIREYLRSEDVEMRHLLHPIVAASREPSSSARAQGRLRQLRPLESEPQHESFVHVLLQPLPAERLAVLEAGVAERLNDVLLVTDDFQPMVERTEAVAREIEAYKGGGVAWDEEVQEVQDFLRWLVQGGCVFLGYRSLSLEEHEGTTVLRIEPDSGLGLLRKHERSHYAAPTPVTTIPEPFRSRIIGGPLLVIARTTAHAPVHRHARMDYVGVKKLDRAGKVRGEHRFLGLLTSKAYAEESAAIPILRRRLAQILQAERIMRGSHDHKEIVAIFNSMPKTELFSVPVEELRADIHTIMSIERTSEVHVTFRPDALERGVAVMVIMPRDKFSGAIRARIQEALGARFGGQVIDYHLALGEGDQARLHFFLAAPRERVHAVRWEDLRHEIAELARSWDDRLAERLVAMYGEERGHELAERYARAFPEAYKAATEVPTAANDIRHLEALRDGTTTRVDVANPIGVREERFTALKLYRRGEQLVLSDIMPVLEHLGLRVFAEDPVTIPALDGTPVYLHTFFVQDIAGAKLDVRRHAERLTAALLEVQSGVVESDPLNRLTLAAGLSWREVDLLRTYCNYAFQIGAAPSRRALVEALVGHPTSAALLVRWFAARFAPGLDRTPHPGEDRGRAVAERRAFLASLDEVATIGDDRVLHALASLVEATVRTNFYKARAAGNYIALKLDCSRIETLPRPRPLFEIYVHSPLMEGVHLRAGAIARGGIRFSDRHDDFRSEILGLMKTQTVKNAVIVPVGAKGGFIVKHGLERPGNVTDAYATLIRGMLDLTDTIAGDRVVSPPGLVCYDEADPYLVVAADKGTATFSDLANGIAAEYGFWLGDAFASGGSHGYDHKKLGITARGAWECVRLHFRELGARSLDPERDVITVTGIGDMSGDVFGNGMLLSRTLKLRAAFDHRHIFLDPDPDPQVSFTERERLFALPRSSWADYRAEALSAGAVVVARGTKVVALSPQVRALVGTSDETIDGERLIQAVLRMETDLLFNGGIGTYVKARAESQAEVGDSTNVAVRVNAAELRARVVAEGGNLGITQRGRIEYALTGGHINTDAIDNSAGVDMSDHEVNLKIALQPLGESGELSLAQRNRLLDELAGPVAALVLGHNRRQSRIVARDQRRSQTRLVEFREMMAAFEAEGLIDRALEALPDRDGLRARRATFLGLTRPELSVLLAYAKMHCTRALAADDLCDDPFLEHVLFAYFPSALVERFPEAIRRHRLRRHLIATTLTNDVVDLMGATFIARTARDTGTGATEVVRAFVVVEALADARALAAGASAAGAVAEARALDTLVPAIERAVRWFLASCPTAGPIAPVVTRFAEPVAAVLRALPPAAAERRRLCGEELRTAGVPADRAEACLDAEGLRDALNSVDVAARAGVAPLTAAAAYWRVGEILDFAWLHQALDGAGGEDRWERRAAQSLLAELDGLHRNLTRRLLSGGADLDTRVAVFCRERARQLDRIRTLLDDLRSARNLTLAGTMVAVRELSRLEESL